MPKAYQIGQLNESGLMRSRNRRGGSGPEPVLPVFPVKVGLCFRVTGRERIRDHPEPGPAPCNLAGVLPMCRPRILANHNCPRHLVLLGKPASTATNHLRKPRHRKTIGRLFGDTFRLCAMTLCGPSSPSSCSSKAASEVSTTQRSLGR
jgi:hypothetical protein